MHSGQDQRTARLHAASVAIHPHHTAPMRRRAPWQNPGPDGLPRWTLADRSIENTDVVVWYVVGAHHVPRVEEWPVMTVTKAGFQLVPDGFFEGNPAIDLPRPQHNGHGHGS